MKWIKFSILAIVGLIILATAALAIAGMGADANRLQSSVVIRRKPAAIWPWIYQGSRVKQWVSWMVEAREDGDAEPVPGRKSVWVMQDRNNNNQRMEIANTVEAVDPPHRLVVALTANEGFRGTATYSLTEQPDGSTLVDSDSRYEFDSAAVRFMMPLVKWQAKKKMLADLDHLRTLVEAQP